MKTYNYAKAVRNDVKTYINENFTKEELIRLIDEGEFYESFKEKLYDDLWIKDSVTGNGSGSYTFSRYEAEENLCHNTDLMWDALEEFGYETSERFEPETIDVIIRCYLLNAQIHRALEEIEENITDINSNN